MKRRMDGRMFSTEPCCTGYVSSLVTLTAVATVTTVGRKRDLIEILNNCCLRNYLIGYCLGMGLVIIFCDHQNIALEELSCYYLCE